MHDRSKSRLELLFTFVNVNSSISTQKFVSWAGCWDRTENNSSGIPWTMGEIASYETTAITHILQISGKKNQINWIKRMSTFTVSLVARSKNFV